MVIVFIIFTAFSVVSGNLAGPTVNIPLGKLEGTYQTSVNGKIFNSFEGIPYASPPVGKHRFKESLPPKPWVDVWKANTKYTCLQYNHFALNKDYPIEGEEDCLYINVYTPNLNHKAHLDVIVFIHGGAFMFGAGWWYQPNILLDNDVVVVTLNYRLGPLGFLSTENDIVPGNNGLKDQILALKWIKENIGHFGGNPNSITIAGLSAGGASVHAHYLTPKSRGLFQRGISQSGCTLNPWVIMENPLERAKELAHIVGCETQNIKQMVECLRRRPSKQLVAVVKKFQPWLYNPFSPFGLVVDKWAADPVFPQHPYILLKNKKVLDVPWMISSASEEGLYPASDFYPENLLEELENNWSELIPHILHYNYTIDSSMQNTISQTIKKKYLKTEAVSRNTYNGLVQLVGDRLFVAQIDETIRLHAAAVKSPVYYNQFRYRGVHSWTDLRVKERPDIGVSHADDTAYVVKMAVDTLTTSSDRAVSKLLVDIFLTFANKGKPDIKINWPEVSKVVEDPITFLDIKSANDLSIVTKDEVGNAKFWNSLPFKENGNLFKVRDEL